MLRIHVACLVLLLGAPLFAGDPFELGTPGKPGTAGLVPVLTGSGSGSPGSVGNTLALSDALPDTSAILVVGLTELAAPFKGGVLGPAPNKLIFGLPVNAEGEFTLDFDLPVDVPVGVNTWNQFWVIDAGAFAGFSASNTLVFTVQPKVGSTALYPGPRARVGSFPSDGVLVDFDQNGTLDLLAVNHEVGTVALTLGDGTGEFGAPAEFPASDDLVALAIGDVNADGLLDVAVANEHPASVSVFLGASGGTLGAATEVLTSVTSFLALDLADLDGDGVLDLVVLDTTADVIVALGQGAGSFGAPQFTNVPGVVVDLEIADFDGDGSLDLALANYTANRVSVLPGLGDGSFGPLVSLPVDPMPQALAAGDLDADGHCDLVASHEGSGSASVIFGLGDGSFEAAQAIDGGDTANAGGSVELGDFDADGLVDIALTKAGFPDLALLSGLGDRSFSAPARVPSGAQGRAMAVGDVNADQRDDLVVFLYFSKSAAILIAEQGEPLFKVKSDWAAGNEPDRIALADFDLDGDVDLATASHQSSSVVVRLGAGDGSFPAAHHIAMPSKPRSIVAGDWNIDGSPDLAVVGTNPNALYILPGSGDGSFGTPERYLISDMVGLGPILTADFNGDGAEDLAFIILFPHQLAVFLGANDGRFTGPTYFPTGDAATSVAAGDLDLDGSIDVAIGDHFAGDLVVLPGLGDGSFGPPQTIPLGEPGERVSSMALADLNSDGVLDCPLGRSGTVEDLLILLGVGDGSFFTHEIAPSIGVTRDLKAADCNGDGQLDLVGVINSDAILLWLGHGDGQFEDERPFQTGRAPFSVAVGDLDADGNLDVLTSNVATDDVSVLLNQQD